jgi:hypothetical protein
MPDFRLAGLCTVVDLATNYQPTPDSAPQRHVKDRVAAFPGSTRSLSQSGSVGIVFNAHGAMNDIAYPFLQTEV